jgi:alpha-tubulin suppressor-like RCC1 family protein
VKIICGDLFAGLLTAQGEVFTWGWNVFGQLGLKDSVIGVVLQPTKVQFGSSKERIIDLACGFNNCIALNDSKQAYVWGKRMGVYPSYEFNLRGIEQTQAIQLSEINQDTPRLLKQNLIFYKFAKVVAGQGNSGLITEDGDLMIQGMNDYGQLGIGNPEISKALIFFGDYMKKDFFHERRLKVLDVTFGAYHTLVLT